jgi:cell wall-associated NlpC family hydrolase
MRRCPNRSGFAFLLILSLAACTTTPSTPGPDRAAPFQSDNRPLPGGPDRSADVVMAAMAFLDLPYRTGGQQAESGFDCSGFTRHVFEQSLGVQLPRQVDKQARAPGLQAVGREQLRAGDLVFFNTLGPTFSHVGIYIGDARFIHAPRAGTSIRVESFAADYWSRRFSGARRPAPQSQAPERVG